MDKIKAVTIEDNEEFLRQVSKEVKFPDDDIKDDIKILERYFNEVGNCLALAAVQLGIPKRLIYLKNTNLDMITKKDTEMTEEEKEYNECRILINPVIIERTGLTSYWEACASCMDYTGLVKRPYKIVVEYFDINANKHKEVFEGFESTVLSHEMDHLDGVLHIDKAEKLLIMNQDERREFRKENPYNIISKTGNYEELIREK